MRVCKGEGRGYRGGGGVSRLPLPNAHPRRLGEGGGEGCENKRPTAPTAGPGSVWRSRPGPRGARSRHRPGHRADRGTGQQSGSRRLGGRSLPCRAARAGSPGNCREGPNPCFGDRDRRKGPRGVWLSADPAPPQTPPPPPPPAPHSKWQLIPHPHPAPGTASRRSDPAAAATSVPIGSATLHQNSRDWLQTRSERSTCQ